jgi:hypothetical protein
MTSGRSIHMICMADVKSVARTAVSKLLHRDLTCLPRYPDVFKRRVEIMQDAARYADDFADEPRRYEVHEVLKEFVDQMGRDIAGYRAAVALFNTMVELDMDPGCTREQLLAEFEASERKSLAWDMAWAD